MRQRKSTGLMVMRLVRSRHRISSKARSHTITMLSTVKYFPSSTVQRRTAFPERVQAQCSSRWNLHTIVPQERLRRPMRMVIKSFICSMMKGILPITILSKTVKLRNIQNTPIMRSEIAAFLLQEVTCKIDIRLPILILTQVVLKPVP